MYTLVTTLVNLFGVQANKVCDHTFRLFLPQMLKETLNWSTWIIRTATPPPPLHNTLLINFIMRLITLLCVNVVYNLSVTGSCHFDVMSLMFVCVRRDISCNNVMSVYACLPFHVCICIRSLGAFGLVLHSMICHASLGGVKNNPFSNASRCGSVHTPASMQQRDIIDKIMI